MARSVFGVTMVVLLAVAGLPLGLSLAQVGPTIQLVNPHSGTSLDVSDKGLPYHLNSWVGTVPPSPLVEYELDVTTCDPISGPETVTRTIGSAEQKGNSFDLLWDIEGDIADTEADPSGDCLNFPVEYVLRAILYTGFTVPGTGVEVARDETEITINHEDDSNPQQSQDDAAEAAEIIYPVNGGPLGVYIRPDGSGGNFTVEAKFSSAVTNYAAAYYTISEFGEEPVWRSCGSRAGTSAVEGQEMATFRCSTAAGDYALDVTGVAVVANDTPSSPAGGQAQFDESGDAHVVTPYFQTVNSLVIEPMTTSDAPVSTANVDADCVQFVTTATDDQGRPIGNMNMDVAAIGPSDQLRFDTYTGSGSVSDANQPPDKGHANPEVGRSCNGGSDSGTNGSQGVHKLPGGPDVKHIESTGGTDLRGEWEFALLADRMGGTQLTAFTDEDDDDKLCGQEKSVDASIGWLSGAPSPTGTDTETESCTVTTPSPTPTPTESGSPTDSPTNGTTSPPPEKEFHSRNVTIRFAHGSLIVSGRVSVDDGTNKCRRRVPVKIQKRNRTRQKWVTKKQTLTNRSGRYSISTKDVAGRYRAAAIKTKKGSTNQDVCLYTRQVKRHRH